NCCDTSELLTYMKLLDVPLGLLINLHEMKVTDGITRLILPGANRENGEKNLCSLRCLLLNSGRGVVEIDFNLANSEGVNMNPESFRGYSRRDGDADFKFLARDTSPTYVDNRALLVANKPEIREYKAVFVVGDLEVSQFSDEIPVNCAPLV